MEASLRERHQVLRFAAFVAVVVVTGCASSHERVEISRAPSATPIASAAPATTTCRRFEREPVDIGIEHATSLALSAFDTCAISDGKLVCLSRTHGASVAVRMPDAVHVAAGGGRRVCALRSDSTLDCFDDGTRFDFSYYTHTAGDTLRRATNLALDDNTLTLIEDDGSLRAIKIDVGSDARGEIVRVGFPTGAPKDGPARAVTIAQQLGGSARCVLVGEREVCSSWHLHQTMAMPGPVAAIGGHCALLEDGRVACFTVRTFELGTPVVVGTLTDAKAIASDDGPGACAIVADGRWTCVGDLGIVFTHAGVGPFARPTVFATPEPVAELAMHDGRACARTKSGRVWCFGCLEL